MDTVCGSDSCLEDGTVCYDEESGDWNCSQCCNMPYGDFTCGGECNATGTLCDIDSTCLSCCSYTYYWIGTNDDYQCGCKEDGASCIPGRDCNSCCNGAYNDGGATCGGTCLPETTACTVGVDCHLCCGWYSFWYSTGQTQCGYESCFPDGEKCIPGVSCFMCCRGGAYDGDGTVCGGDCLPSGAECNALSSCNECCRDYNLYPEGGRWPSLSTSSSPSMSPTTTMSPSGNKVDYSYVVNYGLSSYWNYTSSSMVCGYEMCWKNGTSCNAENTCYKCCHRAIANEGKECGGDCLPPGTKCNYLSTCNSCCDYNYLFDEDEKSHVCASYKYNGP